MTLSNKNFIALVAAILLALVSIFYFANKSHAVYQYGYYDLPIFSQAAIRYWRDEPIYQRSQDLAERYKPRAIIYKFPPPYLLNFLPWFDKTGVWHSQFRLGLTLFFIFTYMVAVFIACRMVLRCRVAKKIENMRNIKNLDSAEIVFVLLAIAYAGVFMPFFLVQGGTSGEAYIIALAALAFASMQRFPYLAGLLLIWLASIKLYPVFLLIYPLLTRQWKVIFSSVISGFFIVFLSVFIFGWNENIFYVQKILPVLLSEPVIYFWAEVFMPSANNQGVVSVLADYGLLPNRSLIWLNMVRLPFLFSMLWLLLKYCKRHTEWQWQSLRSFSLVLLTMMICLPNVFYSYFVVLIFPALALAGFLWTKKYWYGLLSLVVLMSCFIVDDGWTVSLSQPLIAAAAAASPEMLAEAEKEGVNLYLWHHHRLLLILWFQGLAVPFLLYVLWFFTAIALRVAAISRRHTPA